MSILLVDIGNTRVKWATLKRGRVGGMKAAAHKGWGGERIARRVSTGFRARDVEQRRHGRQASGRNRSSVWSW